MSGLLAELRNALWPSIFAKLQPFFPLFSPLFCMVVDVHFCFCWLIWTRGAPIDRRREAYFALIRAWPNLLCVANNVRVLVYIARQIPTANHQ